MSAKNSLPILITLLCAAHVGAQEIRVEKRPAPNVGPNESVVYDDWTVSYSRRSTPKTFELDTIVDSEGAARKEAKRLRAWSEKIKDPDLKLAVILIEGHPSVKRKSPKNKSGELKLKPNRKPGDILKEYKKQVEHAYTRVKNAKSDLISRTKSISKKEFKAVNDQIANYNKERNDIRDKVGYYFSSAPSISQLAPSDLNVKVVPDQRTAEDFPGTKWTGECTIVSGWGGKDTRGKYTIWFRRDGKYRDLFEATKANGDPYAIEGSGEWSMEKGRMKITSKGAAAPLDLRVDGDKMTGERRFKEGGATLYYLRLVTQNN